MPQAFPKPGSSKIGRRYHCKPAPASHRLMAGTVRLSGGPPGSAPPAVDLRPFARDVRDQGQEGACTGFATAAFREILRTVAAGEKIPGYLSPAYLYANARLEEGTFPSDSGASIADEMLGLSTKGACPESFLPYTADPTEAPTPACDTAAADFRVNSVQRLDVTDTDSIKAALAQKQPVVIAFEVYESFETPDTATGLVPLPKDGEAMLGGHGVLVVGYNVKGWIVRNSWGPSWGLEGHVIMPYGYESTCWFEAYTASVQ